MEASMEAVLVPPMRVAKVAPTEALWSLNIDEQEPYAVTFLLLFFSMFHFISRYPSHGYFYPRVKILFPSSTQEGTHLMG